MAFEKGLRVLSLSKPYVAASYREKFRSMAQDPDLKVGVICPPAWGSQRYEPHAKDDYWIKQIPIALNGKNHFHFYRGLEAAILEFKPHILNCEEEHYSLVTYQCFRLAKKHGIKPLFYTWQNIAKKYPAPFSWIEQYVFRHAAAAVIGNGEAGDILRAKGYKGPMEQIPQMGTDLKTFSYVDPTAKEASQIRERLGLPKDAFIVLFAGRLVEEKGLRDLLQSLALLGDRPNVVAVILGDGPQREELGLLSRELRLDDRVIFRSGVPSLETVPYFQAADILCLPSLTRSNWKEQFGRVLTEAMSAGAVPVGSDSGEIPYVIADVGRTFPEGKAQGLARVLRELCDQPELMRELRVRGLARVAKLYSNDVVTARMRELFYRVV